MAQKTLLNYIIFKHILGFCLLPVVGGHILSKGEEQMPPLPVQSQSEEQRAPTKKLQKEKSEKLIMTQ